MFLNEYHICTFASLIKINIIVMCGIVCAFDLKQKSEELRPQLLEMSKKILPTASILMRAVVVATSGRVTDWVPSFGVPEAKVIG